MSVGSEQHGEVVNFLYRQIDAEIMRLKRDWVVRQAAIGVRSPRARRWDTSRIPDLTVIPSAAFFDSIESAL